MEHLDKTTPKFSGHETFPLRHGWLEKGYHAVVKEEKNPFLEDDAIAEFGVGKNMVNSIRYWALEKPEAPSPRTTSRRQGSVPRFIATALLVISLTDLECCKTNKDQNQANNPKSYCHLRLFPTFLFEMMMKRRHPENSPSNQFVRRNLEDNRNCLNDK